MTRIVNRRRIMTCTATRYHLSVVVSKANIADKMEVAITSKGWIGSNEVLLQAKIWGTKVCLRLLAADARANFGQDSQRIFDTPARHRGGLPAGPVQQSRMTTGRGFHDGVGMQTLHSSQSSQPQRQPLGEISRNLVGSQNIHNTTFDTGGATTNQVGKVNLLNGRSGAPFYGRQV